MARVGYTTGVFDLFHVGHLNLLARAYDLCDYLIVGVTTDELSLQRKNKLPVIPFDERISIVSAIRYTGKAVSQSSMDKLAAWQEHQFDVMFVGDDWKGTQSWNEWERVFAPLGVEVTYLPYTHHTSSSILRKSLESLSVP